MQDGPAPGGPMVKPQKALLHGVLGLSSETQVSDLGPPWPSCSIFDG